MCDVNPVDDLLEQRVLHVCAFTFGVPHTQLLAVGNPSCCGRRRDSDERCVPVTRIRLSIHDTIALAPCTVIDGTAILELEDAALVQRS